MVAEMQTEEHLLPTFTMTTGEQAEKPTDVAPSPKLSGVFGGFGDFFDRIAKNPILLLIAAVVLVIIIGKMF